ncbi:MAG: hypothetical protein AAF655_11610 [Bacteroidota bacterium]
MSDPIITKYRYPGVQPFRADQSHLFFGRDEEIDQIIRYLRIEKLLVLHSKSGMGKTSLIHAGIIPLLAREKERGRKIILFRFNNYNPDQPQNPVEVFNQTLERPESTLDQVPVSVISLWQSLKSLHLAEPEVQRYVLVFDQFEELYTYPEELVDEFQKQLADLYYGVIPPDFRKNLKRELHINDGLREVYDFQMENQIEQKLEVKLLFAIRSDRLSLMDRFKTCIPEILNSSYELRALDIKQAQKAIKEPALKEGEFLSKPFTYTEEAVRTILDFLTEGSTKRVEAFELQIICQFVESKVIDDRLSVVDRNRLGADLNAILRNYYQDQIDHLDNEAEKQAAITLIEDHLILENSQRRVSLDREMLRGLVSDELLAKLVNTHLIRREANKYGGYNYEISHDTLIEPILRAKRTRNLKDEIEEAQRQKSENLETRLTNIKRIGIWGSIAALLIFSGAFGYEYFQFQRVNSKLKKVENSLEVKRDSLIQITYEITAASGRVYEWDSIRNISDQNLYDLMEDMKDSLYYKNLELAELKVKVREQESTINSYNSGNDSWNSPSMLDSLQEREEMLITTLKGWDEDLQEKKVEKEVRMESLEMSSQTTKGKQEMEKTTKDIKELESKRNRGFLDLKRTQERIDSISRRVKNRKRY